jgi:hypothetical protein
VLWVACQAPAEAEKEASAELTVSEEEADPAAREAAATDPAAREAAEWEAAEWEAWGERARPAR